MTQPKIKLSTETLQYLMLFEKLTSARALDCTEYNDELIFLVPKEDLIIVKINPTKPLLKLSKFLKKKILVYPYSETAEEFIAGLFPKVKVLKVLLEPQTDGRKIAFVKVDESEKGKAIGLAGINVRRASFLAKKYFSLDLVRVV
ncbi:MAG: NusA-like transcription termination signal-binding factor [Thermoproteota archaeon]|nr:NusA-like transcription termination signal-binding factor [Candidatus Brockarchaeota archaeon]MBO3762830.1 NusA-like transcription termination signal-binding factor [Candidatus Brockarchaeota archaeon]MBO3767731.1 NusA-like transcription termination signal-binding factor [Candidatus Brockarchaeota archaeon]MBO3801439.1 NusA-like transcription termination signal-binding factor [Candidatus Brockarchaeota archaeon]